jgi:hypothetical protein
LLFEHDHFPGINPYIPFNAEASRGLIQLEVLFLIRWLLFLGLLDEI